jgi:hypothetical protein
MLHDTQDYGRPGLCQSSWILEKSKHDVSETASVSVLTWRLEDTWGRNQMQFPKRRVFESSEFQMTVKDQNPGNSL